MSDTRQPSFIKFTDVSGEDFDLWPDYIRYSQPTTYVQYGLISRVNLYYLLLKLRYILDNLTKGKYDEETYDKLYILEALVLANAYDRTNQRLLFLDSTVVEPEPEDVIVLNSNHQITKILRSVEFTDLLEHGILTPQAARPARKRWALATFMTRDHTDSRYWFGPAVLLRSNFLHGLRYRLLDVRCRLIEGKGIREVAVTDITRAVVFLDSTLKHTVDVNRKKISRNKLKVIH